MNRTERLRNKLRQDGCDVDYALISPRVNGVYFEESDAPYIVINPKLTSKQEVATLAHEAGHHFTGLTGHRERDEARADRWAVDYLLSPQDIVSATVRGAQSYHDLADMLHLDEDFVRQAVAILALQYGATIYSERYILHLQPIWVEDKETGQTWPAE